MDSTKGRKQLSVHQEISVENPGTKEKKPEHISVAL